MSIIADFHLHTDHSGDSTASMETQIRSGLARGLSYMCFTDHYDPEFPSENIPDVAAGTFELDYNSYRDEFLIMKDRYRELIGLRFGIEIGLQPHLGDYLRSFFSSHADFDFIIGSNHLCAGMDPYYPAFLESMTEEEALSLYLEDTLKNIRAFPDIDACGHLDYVARYLPHRDAFYTYDRFADLIDAILRELTYRGIALEVNTAPLMKGLRYFNPLPEILRRYREMGGELITIGSDAHVPEKVAGCFEQTSEILLSLGFTHYAVYKERKPLMLPL